MTSPEPADPLRTTFNILFVCTGNTCRSPMAEALAREEIARRGWRHVRVGSAGAAAEPGQPASAYAVAAVTRAGADLSAHESRRLTGELVAWADLILGMSPSHLSAVAELGGEGKVALLGEFGAPEPERGGPVRDPFGGDERMYDETMTQIRALVTGALDRLAPLVRP